VWLDRNGLEVGQVGEPAHYFFSRLSPAGDKVAVDILDRRQGTTDISYFDLTRGGAPSRLTLDPKADWTQVFSPDGRQVAFASAQKGAPHVHTKSLSESGGAVELLPPSRTVQFVSSMSGSSRHMASTAGGVNPRWRSDGRELYFIAMTPCRPRVG
jgi:Tol biopolymer transport system component